MNKMRTFEKTYFDLSIILAIVSIITVITIDFISKDHKYIIYHMLFFVLYIAVLSLKYYAFSNNYFNSKNIYILFKIIVIITTMIGVSYFHTGEWVFTISILTLMFTSITMGRRQGLILYAWCFPISAFILGSHDLWVSWEKSNVSIFLSGDKVVTLFFYLLLSGLSVLLCGKIYELNQESGEENKKLLEQLGEKYQQLEIAQDEIKLHYDKLKETNHALEETNKKLTSSIAEFYTLQQISQAIGSILDIKELLKYVNDIILGVMGVNYSTIILYDEKRMKLKVHTTNIKRREDLVILNDNINSAILLNSLNNSKPIIENFVDVDEFIFTQGREVNSLMCVPLNTKTRKYGLVLIEHKFYSAFDEENVRLLETIGQQVGIAMENAELYQKMQELATIDGLTGIYNRLYFQERLEKEFKTAMEESYSLSLAIFDIDHFKRFNDTFGHLFGDKVLKTITDIVGRSLRNSDIFARYGGEEFIILFPRTSLREAKDKVELLRQRISQTYIKDSLVTASVTVSFGIASYPENATSENELIRHADDALYEAKGAGRNCVKTAG